jgi:hypothetical protein
MAKSKKASVEEPKPEPTLPAPPDPKPQSIITSATEGEIITSRVKTTRELYMEVVDAQKN